MNIDTYRLSKELDCDGKSMIDVVVHIMDNTTGQCVSFDDYLLWDYEDDIPDTYIWERGNFQCDCNRGSFFDKVLGQEKDDYECGDGRYSVNLQNPVTGEYFYTEFKTVL